MSGWAKKIEPANNTCATCAHAAICAMDFEGKCKLYGHEITAFTVNCGLYVNQRHRNAAKRLKVALSRPNSVET